MVQPSRHDSTMTGALSMEPNSENKNGELATDGPIRSDPEAEENNELLKHISYLSQIRKDADKNSVL